MDDREIRRLAEEIVKAFKSAERQVGTQASGSKSGKTYDRFEVDLKTTGKSLGNLSKSLGDVTADLNKHTKLLGMSRKELIAWQDKLFEGVANHEKITNKQQDKIRDSLKKVIQAQSKFGKELYEAGGHMKDIGKIMKETGEYMEHYNDVLEEAGSKTLSSVESMDKLKKALLSLANSSKYQKEVSDYIAKGGKKNLMQAAELLDKEADEKNKLRTEIVETTRKMGKFYGVINDASTGVKAFADKIGAGFLIQAATIGGFLGLLMNNIPQVFNNFKSMASIGITGGGGFTDMLTQMFKVSNELATMGLTIEQYTDIVKKNYVAFARMGNAGFMAAIKSNQDGLMAMGESAQEAAAGAAAMASAAVRGGVSKSGLPGAINEQVKAFQLLKAATGESSEEFAKNNMSIAQSTEYEELAAGIGKKRRASLFADMVKARVSLAKIGFQSTELQMSILKQMTAQQNAKVSDRFKMGADITQASTFLGMGSQGDELRRILLKGGNASEAEKVRKSVILADMTKRAREGKVNAAASGNYGMENIYDTILEKITPLMTDANKAINERDNPNTKKGADLEKLADSIKLPQEAVDAIKNLNQMQATIGDPLKQILAALLALIAMQVGSGLVKFLMRPKTIDGAPRAGLLDRMRSGVNDSRVGRAVNSSRAGQAVESLSGRATTAYRGARVGAAMRYELIKDSIKTKMGATGAKIGNLASSAAGKVSSGLGKVGGFLSKTGIAGGAKLVGKAALRAVPFLGTALMLGESVFAGIEAYGKAAEIFGTKTATTQQKISASIGGAISSLTFGLISTESAAKAIDGMATAVKDVGKTVWDGIKSGFSWMKDIGGYIAETFTKFLGSIARSIVGSAAAWIGGITQLGIGEKFKESSLYASMIEFSKGGSATSTPAPTTAVDPTRLSKAQAEIEKEKADALKAANSAIMDGKDIKELKGDELLRRILTVLEAEYVIISDDYQLKRRQGAFSGFENLGLAGT